LFIKISEMPVGKPLRLQRYDRKADPRQGGLRDTEGS